MYKVEACPFGIFPENADLPSLSDGKCKIAARGISWKCAGIQGERLFLKNAQDEVWEADTPGALCLIQASFKEKYAALAVFRDCVWHISEAHINCISLGEKNGDLCRPEGVEIILGLHSMIVLDHLRDHFYIIPTNIKVDNDSSFTITRYNISDLKQMLAKRCLSCKHVKFMQPSYSAESSERISFAVLCDDNFIFKLSCTEEGISISSMTTKLGRLPPFDAKILRSVISDNSGLASAEDAQVSWENAERLSWVIRT